MTVNKDNNWGTEKVIFSIIIILGSMISREQGDIRVHMYLSGRAVTYIRVTGHFISVFLFTVNNGQQPSTTDNNRQQPTTNLQLPVTTVNDPDQPTTSAAWLNILFIRSAKNSSGIYYNDHIDMY